MGLVPGEGTSTSTEGKGLFYPGTLVKVPGFGQEQRTGEEPCCVLTKHKLK